MSGFLSSLGEILGLDKGINETIDEALYDAGRDRDEISYNDDMIARVASEENGETGDLEQNIGLVREEDQSEGYRQLIEESPSLQVNTYAYLTCLPLKSENVMLYEEESGKKVIIAREDSPFAEFMRMVQNEVYLSCVYSLDNWADAARDGVFEVLQKPPETLDESANAPLSSSAVVHLHEESDAETVVNVNPQVVGVPGPPELTGSTRKRTLPDPPLPPASSPSSSTMSNGHVSPPTYSSALSPSPSPSPPPSAPSPGLPPALNPSQKQPKSLPRFIVVPNVNFWRVYKAVESMYGANKLISQSLLELLDKHPDISLRSALQQVMVTEQSHVELAQSWTNVADSSSRFLECVVKFLAGAEDEDATTVARMGSELKRNLQNLEQLRLRATQDWTKGVHSGSSSFTS